MTVFGLFCTTGSNPWHRKVTGDSNDEKLGSPKSIYANCMYRRRRLTPSHTLPTSESRAEQGRKALFWCGMLLRRNQGSEYPPFLFYSRNHSENLLWRIEDSDQPMQKLASNDICGELHYHKTLNYPASPPVQVASP